jgi:hypothetical protein
MSKYSELAEAVASAAAQWSQSDGGQVFVSRDLLRRAAAALRELEAERDRLRFLCNWAAGRLLDAGDVRGHEKVLRLLEGE